MTAGLGLTDAPTRRERASLALVVGLVLGAASMSAKQTAPSSAPRRAFGSDPLARKQLEAVRADMAPLQFCSSACLAALERLHATYSADDEVVALLRTVYAERTDWEALIRLEQEKPEPDRTPDDRTRLGTWYYRRGRYREAAEVFEGLLAERPQDATSARLAGLALFQIGEHGRAVARLSSAWPRLPPGEAAEAATALGLAHFHQGDPGKAEQALRQALGLRPDYAPAHAALARVLAAKGDERGAKESRDRSAALRARQAAEEGRAIKLSVQSQLASEAVQQKRYEEAERIVEEMLPAADPKLRVQLYRYLSQIRNAAGRGAAAQEALRKAEELSRQEKP